MKKRLLKCVLALFACLTVLSGCDDRSETTAFRTLDAEPVVFLSDIPEGTLVDSNTEFGSDRDLSHALALLEMTKPESKRERLSKEDIPIQPGTMVGETGEYLKMMVIEETSVEIDRTMTDPTTNDNYNEVMKEEVRLNPDDFESIYSWAGPEVEGYDIVIKSMPQEDPTYRTPEDREKARLLVETDVTDEYLTYHGWREQSPNDRQRTGRSSGPSTEEKTIPNIQEYIRAKRAKRS